MSSDRAAGISSLREPFLVKKGSLTHPPITQAARAGFRFATSGLPRYRLRLFSSGRRLRRPYTSHPRLQFPGVGGRAQPWPLYSFPRLKGRRSRYSTFFCWIPSSFRYPVFLFLIAFTISGKGFQGRGRKGFSMKGNPKLSATAW